MPPEPEDQPPAYPITKQEPFQKAELDAGDTTKPGHEIAGTAVGFFQPDKDGQSELPESSVASPISPHSVPELRTGRIYEMTGDIPVLPELPAENEGSKDANS